MIPDTSDTDTGISISDTTVVGYQYYISIELILSDTISDTRIKYQLILSDTINDTFRRISVVFSSLAIPYSNISNDRCYKVIKFKCVQQYC